MLSKRQRQLLSSLRNADGWCTGTVLAKQMGVTARTIRNDIGSIHINYPSLVESSSAGYRLNTAVALPSDIFAADKFAGKDERIAYLLSKLLTARERVDLYDLADELFVSYQTIEKDIKQVEQELQKCGLSLAKRAEHAMVEGSEHNRRKMLSMLVYTELNDNLHDLINYYQGVYEDVELYAVKRILCETLAKNKISANEYAINSIVLHLGISINRIRSNQIIGDDVYGQPSCDGYQEYQLAKQIASEIMQELGVSFPLTEVCNLAYNMLGKTKTQITGITSSNLLEHIEPQYVNTAKALLDDINEAYGLDLYSDRGDTFVRFVYHVRDMIVRIRNHLSIKNPIQDKLKISYPLLYELGVFMADRLGEIVGKTVSEEEIAFLAIHVGSFLENQRQEQSGSQAVRTWLICPQHSAMFTTIMQALQHKFGDRLVFVNANEQQNDNCPRDDIELILSTVPLGSIKKDAMQEFVVINPFLMGNDYRRVEDAIERTLRSRAQQEFAKTTLAWFRKELFFAHDSCHDEWEAIELMGKRMQEMGYVGESFTPHVIRREKLSSTTYGGGFAIPHSTEMDALTTCIAVMVCRRPIRWGEFEVSVVFLIAINHDNRHAFAEFYDTLAGLFAEPDNLHRLYGAQTFDDFIRRLNEIV